MGLVRKDSTILWKGAERGTLYHEAFHRVSLLTISPKERKKIYEFYRNRTGFVGSDKQVEEALAEDFRQYMLNKVDQLGISSYGVSVILLRYSFVWVFRVMIKSLFLHSFFNKMFPNLLFVVFGTVHRK